MICVCRRRQPVCLHMGWRLFIRKYFGVLYFKAFVLSTASGFIEVRIEGVEVSLVHMVLCDPKRFAESLEVHHFTFTQELDWISDIRIVHESQDVIIGFPRFLLGGEIFMEIRKQVAGRVKIACIEGNARCRHRIQAGCMVYKIGIEPGFLDFIHAKVAGELIDDGTDHFHMGQFAGTWRVSMPFGIDGQREPVRRRFCAVFRQLGILDAVKQGFQQGVLVRHIF